MLTTYARLPIRSPQTLSWRNARRLESTSGTRHIGIVPVGITNVSCLKAQANGMCLWISSIKRTGPLRLSGPVFLQTLSCHSERSEESLLQNARLFSRGRTLPQSDKILIFRGS